MSEDDIARLLPFFKALADQSRLRIIGLLSTGERTVDELATVLHLRAPTVSHHLARLKRAGLVSMKADGTHRLYSLDSKALQQMSRQLLNRETVQSFADDLVADDWERKILSDYFRDGRLRQIPSVRKKRMVILRWLAGQFERGRTYTQEEVNEILGRFHDDVAFLRREMIGFKLLERDHRTYQLPEGTAA